MQGNGVCMVTTAHGPFDDRIFHKECLSLVKEGYSVTLIVPHSRNENVSGVKIIPLPAAKGRLHRMVGLTFRAFQAALKEKAAVYHIHDPELLFVGLLLKILLRTKVIYDVHEDYEKKILSKEWIRKEVRTVLSKMMVSLERLAVNLFDYTLAADSNIKGKFHSYKTEVIGNYTPLKFITETHMRDNDILKVIYIGGIARDRGSDVMIETMKYLKYDKVELHLLGEIKDKEDKGGFVGKEKIAYHGFVPWHEVNEYLTDADIGLLLLQPTPSYVSCAGEGVIKLFEYMAMKLPVVISDFPFLKKMVTDIGCGICVDPTDPAKIAGVIRYLHCNPALRKKMGEKGRKAVMEKYNWEKESKKLIAVYQRLFNHSVQDTSNDY